MVLVANSLKLTLTKETWISSRRVGAASLVVAPREVRVMSESATSRLTAQKASALLESLSAYVNSKNVVVQIQKGSQAEAGLPVHLDGKAFMGGFVEYLKSRSEDPSTSLDDLMRILEISSYVRAGGSKQCLYRLETGCSISPTDFYDRLSEQLRFAYIGGELYPADVPIYSSVSAAIPSVGSKQSGDSSSSSYSLLLKLKAVSEADEEIVQRLQNKIEGMLLSIAQKLESLTQDPFQ